MYSIELSNTGTATFRIAAIIISFTCVFYTRLLQRKGERSRLFLMLLYIMLIDSFVGFGTDMLAQSSMSYTLRVIFCNLLQMIYFSTHFAMVYLFYLYIIHVCKLTYKYSAKARKIMATPIIATEALLLSNPATGVIFHFDNTMTFHRGVGTYIAYFVSACYFIQCVYILVKYWRTINQVKKLAMFYFLSLAALGILIQMVFPDIICELLCESIGLMGLMVMIEKEDDKIDAITKAYNRAALVNDLKSLISMKIPFKIICMRIDNSEVYRRLTGYESFDVILVKLTGFLMDIAGENNVYRNGDASFFILLPMASAREMLDMAKGIEGRFKDGFAAASGTLNLNESILCASFPEQLDTPEDIMLLADVPFENNSENSIFINKELDFLIRNIAIEKAISQGISEQNFQVYYQPIYGKKCGCIKAMQALLKLHDSRLGNINYNEFMPIAERAGFADTLEARMIESIFRFVGEEVETRDLNLDYVLIHLMSVKVLNKSLVETIMGLKYKYNINPAHIVFDIDDSILNFSNENLAYVLNELYEGGFSLFLGNYDISNLGQNEEALSKFRGVVLTAWKFLDESIIDQGQVVLRNRTDMLSQLNKQIIITGVDNYVLYEGITESSGEYMSGKYLSEPLSREEIIDKFNNEDRVVPPL